ncbi:septum formation inhibitor Maf [Mariniflexile ostreae]|uniref:Septum formation inhibitor Maf n=1 Tax=Mariniflexile ostreae TaxID=1520892 RepID=A0ABV5F844_9FLAO
MDILYTFKKNIKTKLMLWAILGFSFFIVSCNNDVKPKEVAPNSQMHNTTKNIDLQQLSQAFKTYWYAGEAEISSYTLEQARYGEIRNGKAVLIYVTEDFLPDAQVKADTKKAHTVSVLKLNATKNFNTGIYPYSIMQSTFFPVSNQQHAIKVSSSIQEWCGHVYVQLNNKEDFEITSHSYFEGEGDENFKLDKAILENELWTQLRIDPKTLPTGLIELVPALEYTRLHHVPIKAFKAHATLKNGVYSISYPELDRTLSIHFNPKFPYHILSWEESFKSGFGKDTKILTTKATRLNTIKSAYWGKKSNKDETLRESLELN